MKSLIKNTLILIGKLFSFVYPATLHEKLAYGLRNTFNKIYTGWLSGSFNEFGGNSVIVSPNVLIGEKYISIKDNVYIDRNAVLCAWDTHGDHRYNPSISIGSNTCIGEYCHISAMDKIEIGENVLTGRWVTIVDNAHGSSEIDMLRIAPTQRPLYSKGAVKIGNKVWIGDKVTILAGVTIGNNSVVGANSVVTNDVPEFAVVGGIPAKVLKVLK